MKLKGFNTVIQLLTSTFWHSGTLVYTLRMQLVCWNLVSAAMTETLCTVNSLSKLFPAFAVFFFLFCFFDDWLSQTASCTLTSWQHCARLVLSPVPPPTFSVTLANLFVNHLSLYFGIFSGRWMWKEWGKKKVFTTAGRRKYVLTYLQGFPMSDVHMLLQRQRSPIRQCHYIHG